MAIPELKTAFCGSSLTTGSKVIGWFNIVIGTLGCLILVIGYGILVDTVNNIDNEVLGKEAIKAREVMKQLRTQTLPEKPEEHFYHLLLASSIIGQRETSDPEVLGMKVKEFLQGSYTVVYIIVSIIFVINAWVSAVLLIGTYKRKSSYVGFYLALSILGLIFNILGIFSTFNITVITVIGFFINFYFTWVIYSFYKELRRPQYMAGNIPCTSQYPEHKLLEGDVPIMLVPDKRHNYYPQK